MTKPRPRRPRLPLREHTNPWSRRRVALGLSLNDVARASGLPKSVVGLIDRGRMIPSPDEAAAILKAFEAARLLAEAEPRLDAEDDP